MKNKFFLFIFVFFLSGSLAFAQEAPVETETTEETATEQTNQNDSAQEETQAEADTAEGEAFKATLLDFSLLTGDGEDGQNSETIIELADYSTYALSEEERAEFDVSLRIIQPMHYPKKKERNSMYLWQLISGR